MTDQISDTLLRAIDVVHERGHGKGSFVSPNGAVCISGAVRIAAGARVEACCWTDNGCTDLVLGKVDPNLLNSLHRRVLDAINLPQRMCELYTWNDLDSTDADTVTDVLKRASELPS